MENQQLSNFSQYSDSKVKFWKRFFLKFRAPFFVVVLLVLALYFFLIAPPRDFPNETLHRVKSGQSLRSVSLQFKEDKLIKSRITFETLVMIYGDQKKIIAGYYLFERPLSVFTLAKRISEGKRNVASLKITIPEGYDRWQIAELFDKELPLFDEEIFLQQVESKAGYLFPDTYFFLPEATEADVLEYMLENFQAKVGPLRDDILASEKSEQEIITMASIIEREANGEDDRGYISSILWKRLEIGMALQVDAWPETYERPGLPSAPIANPGLDSIKAALYPVESPYLYYLHDKEGNTYYAKTFDEHRQNIAKYLR